MVALDRFHCTRLSTNSPIFATTTPGQELVPTTMKSTTDTDVGRSNNIIFIAVGIGGGITFLVMISVVVCVFVSLSVRRKTRLNSIMKSKVSEQIPFEQQHLSNSDQEL